jgi:hypothetical protein
VGFFLSHHHHRVAAAAGFTFVFLLLIFVTESINCGFRLNHELISTHLQILWLRMLNVGKHITAQK